MRLIEDPDPLFRPLTASQPPTTRLGRQTSLLKCDQVCAQTVDDMVCFRASTEPGYDRWYRVRYSISDNGRVEQRATVFVVVKEIGQDECSGENFFQCQVRNSAWKESILQVLGAS